MTSGRTLGGPRSRRSNMHFSSSGGISALSPSGRESVDPIAELLSQLSGVRRGAPQSSQLQQLHMQIQLERQHVSVSELLSYLREFIPNLVLDLVYIKSKYVKKQPINKSNNSSSSGGSTTTGTFASSTSPSVIIVRGQFVQRRCWLIERIKCVRPATGIDNNQFWSRHNDYIEPIIISGCVSIVSWKRHCWLRECCQQCPVVAAATTDLAKSFKSIAIFVNTFHASHIGRLRDGSIGAQSG